MMLLALETSTRTGSIALVSGDKPVIEFQTGIRQTYSEMLLPLIDQALHAAAVTIDDIDAFAVAQGPGSFTALRIGMSLIAGFSLATRKRVVPVPSLDGLAYNCCCSGIMICPLLDARRGEVYGAFYRRAGHTRLERLTPYRVSRPDRMIEAITEPVMFLGDGATLHKDLILETLHEKAIFAPLHLSIPRASAIAALALDQMSTDDSGTHENPLPIYVRAPDAETK